MCGRDHVRSRSVTAISVVAMWLPCGSHVVAMSLQQASRRTTSMFVMHDAKAIGYCDCVFMYIASLFMLIDLHDFQLNEDHDPEHNP